ncbi:MAG: NnrS family protein [Magnetococcales bacterium]|nr:NnrS family protein [Magnetococcales bacterium]
MPQKQPLTTILFAYGFRPFFLVASFWSVFIMTSWILLLNGYWSLPTFLTPVLWHAHELLFGFVAASAAGFLLTASPNWSKKPALKGTPLQWLLFCWVAGRVAIVSAPWWPAWLVAALDLLFLLALIVSTGTTLWYSGNKMHRIFPLLLTLFLVGNGLMHGEATGLLENTARTGLYLGVDAIVFFLVMVGGHIMPMFTRNALAQTENLPPFKIIPILEIAGLVTMVGVVLADVFLLGQPLAAPFLVLAGIVQAVRFSQWHSLKTVSIPLLWVLHLGYACLVLGLVGRGIAQWNGLISPSAALHILTVGAMGLFTLGIMSRVSLAHTGRALQASPQLTLAYALIASAAVVRVFGVGLWPMEMLSLAALLWIVGFGLFLMEFFLFWIRPRVDGQPG